MTISSSPGGGGVEGVCLPGITQAGQVDVALVRVRIHYQDSGVSIDEHNDNDNSGVSITIY